MTPKIICVGACYLDTILTIPHFPTEDSKLRATSLTTRRGGNTPNTLEVLSQLLPLPPSASQSPSAELFFVGVLPAASSPAAKFIADSLPGVHLSPCATRGATAEPARSFILRSEETGSRTIVNYNTLPELDVREFASALAEILGTDGKGEGVGKEGAEVWVHFEGRIPATTVEFIRCVRGASPDAIVSVEVEKAGREGLEQLAALADVVFFSKSWAMDAGFGDASSFLIANGLGALRGKRLFCTWGEEGAAAWDGRVADGAIARNGTTDGVMGEDGALLVEKAREGIVVKDTVGAGDTFIAGVLSVLAAGNGGTVGDALRRGNFVAGEKVGREGFGGLGEAVGDSSSREMRR